jgi:hypothetical protein
MSSKSSFDDFLATPLDWPEPDFFSLSFFFVLLSFNHLFYLVYAPMHCHIIGAMFWIKKFKSPIIRGAELQAKAEGLTLPRRTITVAGPNCLDLEN